MDACRSQFMELLLCHNKKKRGKKAKEGFECERTQTSEKRERQKKGRKVLGFDCVRRIQRKEERKKGGIRRATEIM